MKKQFTKNFTHCLSDIKTIAACMVVAMLMGSFSAQATLRQYTSAQMGTLKTDLAAGTYDIYELTTSGGVYTTALLTSTDNYIIGGTKSPTIRALAGLAVKPIIRLNDSKTPASTIDMFITTVANLTVTFDGLEFNGVNAGAGDQPMFFYGKSTTSTNCKVVVTNCYFHNCTNATGVIRLDGAGSSMDIQGSTFDNCTNKVLSFNLAAAYGSLTLKNNTFSNIGGTSFAVNYVTGASGTTATIDHCTFYNVPAATNLLNFQTMTNVGITNCIFDGIAGGVTFATPTIDYCYLGFATPPTGTNTFVTSTPAPAYVNAAGLDFTLSNSSSFVCGDTKIAGNTSYYSSIPKLTTPTVSAPTSATATGFNANFSSVANAVSYYVYVYLGTNLISSPEVPASGTAITGLMSGLTYTYTVKAKGDGISYINSDVSAASSSIATLDPYAAATFNTNFADGTWGTINSTLTSGAYGSPFSINGFDLVSAGLLAKSVKGAKGEVHANCISVDRITYGGKVTLPTVNSVAQIEIHASTGSGDKTFQLKEFIVATNTWSLIGTYTYNAASKASGLDSIFIIPITRAVPTKFRIENPETGTLYISQVITRTTNPTLIDRPVISDADGITESGFTAHWTPVSNASGYDVLVYSGTTLKSTTNASGQSASSLAITGLIPNTTYTYKVKAKGNNDVDYSDSFLSFASNSFTTLNVFNITGASIISSLSTLTSASDLTVSNGGSLTADASSTVHNITISGGGKVTLSSGFTLTANNFTITSDVTNGTGTFVDSNVSGGLTVNGTTNVNQYITAGRNWYISSPISNGTTGMLTNATHVISYNEPGANWVDPESGSLTVMKGYGLVGPSGSITFSGTLNTGPQSIALTYSGASKTGFNLVGNPYPSYLNWTLATATACNTLSTIWYRTFAVGAHTFYTFNADGGIGSPGGVTGVIAPMQAFWVRANAAGTLAFDNTMRANSLVSNLLKAPAAKNTTQQVLRLEVSNGTNIDETVVYFNPNASDGYDAYDSPKMSNANAAIPEIYTMAGTEQLVINGLKTLIPVEELALGFTPGQSNTFTIKASEISNFDTGTRVFLKDKLLNTEQELTVGNDYSFTSDATPTNTRFTLIFRAAGIATALNTGTNDQNVLVYKNANNQITVKCSGDVNNESSVVVYNAVGQKLMTKQLTSNTTVLNNSLSSGVYMVTVTKAGRSVTKKVILD